ncbi:hypothetical protein, partial [Streptomyces scabiei]|uniref:hypothetical protein n=1 Tax=Streptomyces scabiei TaxID=1930 RepID=UPI0038F7A32A
MSYLSSSLRWYEDGKTSEIIQIRNHAYWAAMKSLKIYLDSFKKRGKRVYLVLGIPTSTQLDPRNLIRRSLADFPSVFRVSKGGLSKSDDFFESYLLIEEDMRAIARETGVTVL